MNSGTPNDVKSYIRVADLNHQFREKTAFVRRYATKTNARKKISLEGVGAEFVLVSTSFLDRFQADVLNLGVLGGKNLDLGPL